MSAPARDLVVTSRAAGMMLAFAGAACWSTGGFFVRLAGPVDVFQINFYRALMVFAVMGLWLLNSHGRRLPAVFVQAGWNSAFAGVALAMAGLTFVGAVAYISVGQAIFMTGISPFASALLARVFLKETIQPVTWAAMAIAAAGLGVMTIASDGGGAVTGMVLALASGFAFACYNVALRAGARTDMVTAIIWNAVFLFFVCGGVLYGRDMFSVPGLSLAAISGMAIVQLCMGLWLFTRGSRSVPAAELGLISLAEPVLAPIWVWLAFGETTPVPVIIGGGIILGAIVVQTLGGLRRG
jgi:drug/metabolite transporter, DME family